MPITVEREDTRTTEFDRVFRLTPAQAHFIQSSARYPAYVAGWGTGKSTALIIRAMIQTEKYPNNLGVIFRKEFTDLRDSTMKDFENYTGLKVDSERSVKRPNGSQILFRHLEEMANLQNMNLGWFAIEQAEELESDDYFFKLHGRLRRQGSERCGFIIANTNGHNWIYKLWKSRPVAERAVEGYDLIEANSFDAKGYLPDDTIKSWEKLKETKPKIYNRFILNSWEESDTTDVIIQPTWVDAAVNRDLSIRYPIRRVVSIDVARYGDDKSVFYAIENGKVLGREEWEKKGTMETVGLAQIFARKHGDIQSFAIDEIGVGAGVADRLQELGKDVVFVNSSKESAFKERFYNLRAEIYGMGAELFEAGKVQIQGDDIDLREQLSWAKYKAVKSNGIYQVEAKDDIKKRYGRSPDNADAFLNGLWALERVSKVVKRDAWKEDAPKYSFNPATV